MSPPYPNGGIPSNQTIFMVRKNGAGNDPLYNTNLFIDLGPANIGSTSFNNNTGTVTVAAGDKIGLYFREISMNGAMTSKVFATFFLVTT